MGHSIGYAVIPASMMDVARERATKARHSYFPRRGDVVLSELLSIGIQEWHHSSEEHGNPSPGVVTMAKIMSMESAANYGSDYGRVNSGNSIIIPVAADSDVTAREKTVKIEVSAERAARIVRGRGEASTELDAMGIEYVTIDQVSTPKLRKPIAQPAAGKLATKYFLTDHRGHPAETTGSLGYPTQPVLHDSMADVRAAGIALMASNQAIGQLEVRSQQVREHEDQVSHTLLTITRPEQMVTLTVTYTQHIVKANAQPESYYVAFDFHH